MPTTTIMPTTDMDTTISVISTTTITNTGKIKMFVVCDSEWGSPGNGDMIGFTSASNHFQITYIQG